MSDADRDKSASTPVRKKPAGLGRGLSSLLGEVERETSVDPGVPDEGSVRFIPVGRILPHPNQPRRHFDAEAIGELARSIEARGMIQPIVVRPRGVRFQIVAGERRWRAAQQAKLHRVPVIVRDFDDAEALEIAIVENIQREDLNAIEEAEAYQRLIEDFGHTQAALGRLVHKSRSHVANLLRLLDLPKSVRDLVVENKLDMGHARAIINAPDPEALAQKIVSEGLTVRAAEDLARNARPGGGSKPASSPPAERDADIMALEQRLSEALGLGVRVDHKGGGGKVQLDYKTLDQLDLICLRLSGGNF